MTHIYAPLSTILEESSFQHPTPESDITQQLSKTSTLSQDTYQSVTELTSAEAELLFGQKKLFIPFNNLKGSTKTMNAHMQQESTKFDVSNTRGEIYSAGCHSNTSTTTLLYRLDLINNVNSPFEVNFDDPLNFVTPQVSSSVVNDEPSCMAPQDSSTTQNKKQNIYYSIRQKCNLFNFFKKG